MNRNVFSIIIATAITASPLYSMHMPKTLGPQNNQMLLEQEEWTPIQVFDHDGIIPHNVHAAWFNEPEGKTVTTLSKSHLPITGQFGRMRTTWDTQTGLMIKNSFASTDPRLDKTCKHKDELFDHSDAADLNSACTITDEVEAELKLAPIARHTLNGALLSNDKQLMITACKNGVAILLRRLSSLQRYKSNDSLPTYVTKSCFNKKRAIKKTTCRYCCEPCTLLSTVVCCCPCLIACEVSNMCQENICPEDLSNERMTLFMMGSCFNSINYNIKSDEATDEYIKNMKDQSKS